MKYLILLMTCVMLTACGQAGKLYLPNHEPQSNMSTTS